MGRGALLISPEQGASCEEVLGMPGVKAGPGRRAGELPFPLSKRTAGTVERGMEMASGQCGTAVSPVLGGEMHFRSQVLFLSGPACLFTSQRVAMVLLVAVEVFMNAL